MQARSFFSALFVCCAVCVFAGPVAAATAEGLVPSPPSSVLFYPREAQLTVEETLTPARLPGGGMGFRLAIPASAQRATFFAVVAGAAATGVAWEETAPQQGGIPRVPDEEDTGGFAFAPQEEKSPERRALLEKIVAAQQERAEHQGSILTADARMALWSAPLEPQTPRVPLTLEDRLKLDGALAQQLPPLHLAREKAATALALANQRLEQALDALREFDAAHAFVHAVIPYTGKSQGPVAVRYGYMVPASFTGSYSVSAMPGDGKVTIEQFASLQQFSGTEWKDVDVALTTMPRSGRLSPFSLSPWVLSLMEAMPLAASASKRMAAPAMEMAMDIATSSAPEPEEWSTFRLWRLGKKTLASGTPTRVTLAVDTYTANFFYTLRPALEPQGYLTAEVTFPKAVEMLAGTAQFFVDGVAVGERSLALAGEKAVLFFGADPLVSAVMTNMAATSGEQGLIRKEQTYLRDWEMTVKNARNRTVDVRVEDAVPVAAVESIGVKVTSTPVPQEVMSTPSTDEVAAGAAVPTKIFQWKAQLGTGESMVIRHRVNVTAPADKPLQPGR